VAKDRLIVRMGRIGAPFGVKGWVHLHSYTEPSSNILNYKTLYIKSNDWQPFVALEARPQGKAFVARLQGVETREAAALLTNSEIGVPRECLPMLKEDEYYWSDLIGLTVVNETGEELGQVAGLLETGSNDVLMVKGASKDHLIPYIPGDYVLEVNLESRILRVSWDPEF